MVVWLTLDLIRAMGGTMKKFVLFAVAAAALTCSLATPAAAAQEGNPFCTSRFGIHFPAIVLQLFYGQDGLCGFGD